jgi:hypothetical protein
MPTASEVKAAYDEETHLPAEWKTWPTAPKAARLLGCSVRHIGRHVDRGTIERHQCPDSTFRFNPTELEDARETILENIASSEGVEKEGIVSEGFKSGTELVKQSHKHAEEMFKLYSTPIHQLLEMYRDENKRLKERVIELELKRDELAAQREALISEEHMRRVLETKMIKADERKDKAFKMVLDKVPSVWDRFIESKLGTSPQVKATIELLKGFDPENLKFLLETEILTPEQKAQVRTILNMPQPVPEVKPDDPEEPTKPVVETTGES